MYWVLQTYYSVLELAVPIKQEEEQTKYYYYPFNIQHSLSGFNKNQTK
jgi:hypothetical protein